MPPVDVLIQLSDCEAIGGGWLEQPVNAWSSLAFAGVGVGIAATAGNAELRERNDRLVFGGLLIATGIGSFLFHGPQPSAAQFLHDVTFLAALWFLIVTNVTGALTDRSRTGVTLLGILLIAVVLGAGASTNAVTGVLVVALVVSEVVLWRTVRPDPTWYGVAIAALLVGLGLFTMGRTGSALCDPGSLLQAHAGWHALAAVFLGAYFFATFPARTRSGSR